MTDRFLDLISNRKGAAKALMFWLCGPIPTLGEELPCTQQIGGEVS